MKVYDIWSALVLGLFAFTHEAHGKRDEKILMSSLKSLTLRDGQMTKGRRVSPIPQLKCVGGSAKGLYNIDVMRCKNMGSDYEDEDSTTWACTADLPSYFKLGSTDVICEGYSNPDDKYILKGSCGVEYRLALTDAGYEKYGGNSYAHSVAGWWPTIFQIIFWSVVGIIIYSAWKASNDPRRPRGNQRPQRPWFGGGGPGNDPPPPYDPSPPYYGKPTFGGQTAAGGWSPGFWGGLAAGAAGTYMMGRNRGERNRSPTRGLWSSGRSSSGVGSSFAESSSAGASRHESTGFGQTRRR